MFVLEKVAQTLTARAESELRRHRLSTRYFAALCVLARGATQQQRLADDLGMSRSNVARLLDDLEAHDLVLRSEHPGDRRSLMCELTRTGREAHAEADAAVAERERIFLGPLVQPQRDEFTGALRSLLPQHLSPIQERFRDLAR